MSEYTPDNWVVIKIKVGNPHYRVLAGWSGGYTTGDSWKLNSGIIKVKEDDRSYHFYGLSGSVYCCGKESYTLRMNTAPTWAKLQEIHGGKVEIMPEDTDWTKVDWIIGVGDDD